MTPDSEFQPRKRAVRAASGRIMTRVHHHAETAPRHEREMSQKFGKRRDVNSDGALPCHLPSLAIRCASRETLRLALFLWSTPRWAARMITGSAAFSAATAASRLPLAIASSTLRTELRIVDRRALLIAVRRAILRVALRADVVLAIRFYLVHDRAARVRLGRSTGRTDRRNWIRRPRRPPRQ